MRSKAEARGRIDIALGAIMADGCFCLAFTLHLLGKQSGGLALADFLGMGVILCVFLTSCWVIYDEYWLVNGGSGDGNVKKLHIKELEQGAAIEFDGKSYRVNTINRATGEIRLEKVGQPGQIIVQIEGKA